MSECMPIPDNWKDFVKEYSFKDIREIYTNGSWLIPTFRVEQMMEHFAKPEWISVKDRLPEQYTDVVVLYDFGRVGVNWTNKENEFIEHPNCKVTHWMPLPEPPESGDDVDVR